MTEKICRLCLQTITESYQTIGESTLKTLKLNPSISRETVICTECADYLEVFSNLKPACVYMRNSILPLAGLKNEVNLDPECKTTSNLNSLIETGIKCSFCATVSGRGSLVTLSDSKEIESLVNLLRQRIPETNLKYTEELLTCETCIGTLRGLFSFISKCLEMEEKIIKYTEIEGTDDNGQVKLKDIQQFILGSTVKLEIEFDANELEERCDRIQKEYPIIDETKIKNENEINNLETIIKTEDVDIKSEHSDSESFHEPFDEHRTAGDPLEISVLTAKTTLTKRQHLLDDKNSPSTSEANPSEIPMFKCELCSYQTKRKGNLPMHFLVHKMPSEVPMFKCELCSYQTKRRENLPKHLLTHKTSSEVPMFKCELCSYETKRKGNLQKHNILIHKASSDVPMFKCELCSYQTKRKHYMPTHLLTHETHRTLSDIQKFKCEFCRYQAKCKKYLRVHLLTHKNPSELRMFKCEFCPYQTKRKETLTRHMLTHKTASELPTFKCEFCSYRAKRKRCLQMHMLTHKAPSEMPTFKCALCSYQTGRKDYLQKHLFTHKTASEVPMFKCELCSFQTKRKEYIPKHLLTHKRLSEVPLLECEFCPYRTKYKKYLRTHLLTHKTVKALIDA